MAHELIDTLKNADTLPFDLELREGELEDYLKNRFAWPLMSDVMKKVIETSLAGTEHVSWMTAHVRASGKLHSYLIPMFNEKLDVLDFEKTKFVKGTDQIIKPCFSSDKIKNYRMFPKPGMFWRITP